MWNYHPHKSSPSWGPSLDAPWLQPQPWMCVDGSHSSCYTLHSSLQTSCEGAQGSGMNSSSLQPQMLDRIEFSYWANQMILPLPLCLHKPFRTCCWEACLGGGARWWCFLPRQDVVAHQRRSVVAVTGQNQVDRCILCYPKVFGPFVSYCRSTSVCIPLIKWPWPLTPLFLSSSLLLPTTPGQMLGRETMSSGSTSASLTDHFQKTFRYDDGGWWNPAACPAQPAVCILSSSWVSVSTITLPCLTWMPKWAGCSVLSISWIWVIILWWCLPPITVSPHLLVRA